MAAIHLTFLSLKDHIIYIFVSHIGYIKMRLQVTQSMKLELTVGRGCMFVKIPPPPDSRSLIYKQSYIHISLFT